VVQLLCFTFRTRTLSLMRLTCFQSITTLAVSLAAFPITISAQVNFASVTGQLVDAGNGGVPRVNLVLKSTTTGLARPTTTDGRGFYEFPAVKPGESPVCDIGLLSDFAPWNALSEVLMPFEMTARIPTHLSQFRNCWYSIEGRSGRCGGLQKCQ
jgi:hypothetical protein